LCTTRRICNRFTGSLLWQHYGNAWQSPAVIQQAHRTLHALRMPAKTPLAGDKIDAPAASAVPFRPYCGGVVTRTRNVSEYMLVLAQCLVLQLLLPAGSIASSAIKLLRGRFEVFAPQGRHVAPMGVKFGNLKPPSVPSSVPNFTAIGATIRV